MKNIIIVILALLVLGEGALLVRRKFSQQVSMAKASPTVQTSPSPDANRPKPMMVGKGVKLQGSPLEQYAYKVAPGDMNDDAKKALVGFSIDTQKQADGSLVVKFTPKDSDDQNQQYIVKTGESLYFVEMTPLDDKPDQDKDINYRDDYGIIVDQNGIIQ